MLKDTVIAGDHALLEPGLELSGIVALSVVREPIRRIIDTKRIVLLVGIVLIHDGGVQAKQCHC